MAALSQVAQMLTTVMQFDPTVRADVNFGKAFRGAYSGTGAPAEWLEDPAKAEAIKTQVRAQQAAAQQAADVGHIGEQAGKIATTAKNVGEAASSLQAAGLM
jgi:hypothetical protein